MFSSLRSRLWLSYAFLIATALSVVALILLIFLIRNPVLYRQTLEKFRTVQQVIVRDGGGQGDSLKDAAQNAAETFDVRVLLFGKGRELIWDTQAESQPAIPFPQRKLLAIRNTFIHDKAGNAWLFSLQKLPDGSSLVVAAPRPSFSVWNIFADDLLPIFLGSGLIALILSLAIAFGFSRWIADPLQKVVLAAQVMPSDGIKPVEMQGPHEVQELMRAFNAMVARMQASRKSQREFVANVSHELKTPLTSIQGFSQAILDGTAETVEDRTHAAQVIYDESARMHRLVLDLLDLAKLDSGTADITMVPVNITALLNSIAEKFMPQSQKAGVDIKVKTDPSLPAVVADGDRLSQVFTNFVDNALKFTQQGGSIRLQASVLKGEMLVAVMDNGAGMTPEVQAHIFERFYQADTSRTGGKKHGAGLGLAIAHEIVQAHGGRINVRSKLGEGTAFEVFLPLTKK